MDDFDTSIQEAIEERLTVLFEIERAIFTRRYSLSLKHQEIFSTQSISMIYAIWEGFIQTSFNLYIDELNKSATEFYDFSDDIVIYHMESSFKQLKEYPNKENQKINFFKRIREFHKNESQQSISRVINTQSNVGFEVLNKLLKTFSLEQFPEHWKGYKHPNPNLKESMALFLKLRNTIAHGGDLLSEDKVSQSVYNRFRNLVKDLMYEIRLKMLDSLDGKTFLR